MRRTGAEARALRETATPGPWRHPNAKIAHVVAPDCVVHSIDLATDWISTPLCRPRWIADAALIAAAPDLAATVEALEAELAEARLCLLAEAGDPRGAEGLRGSWGWYLGRWQLVDGDADLAFLRRTRVGGATDPYGLRWSKDGGATLYPIPAGLTIREAMRWVEREVGL